MGNTIITAIVALSAVWVYVDATNHKIGKTPGGGFFNLSAGAWGVLMLLLWIVAFPSYLIKRGSLIEKAAHSPIEANGRSTKIAILAVIGAVFTAFTYIGAIASELPSCDSSDSKKLVGQIIESMPAVQIAGIKFVSLKDIEEQGFNQEAQIRSCHGTLVTTQGENELQYSIKWSNQQKGEFYIEAQLQ
ncbi:hypothetical protein ACFOJE_19400 [Azotobacter bryophylli]|uniref:Uncharacterized protein n=1 Tax=Azotobacter bryophylli TaxID=1986537 RepID=A0ABV7AY40_9GAMM